MGIEKTDNSEDSPSMLAMPSTWVCKKGAPKQSSRADVLLKKDIWPRTTSLEVPS